ncbi:DSD1 family PLP-dependent enzyme [Facilibium subflavum]|uniref:DSD1 family PLP-dependent enzyme n=1 Tax=Facilibium subflavum TaxID=2219058 RepID=UPI000E64BA11|nr:DSD1 family PLP-dependent enzyme [Facilibium subflavum]
MIGRHKFQLDTPCLVIDKDKLMHNLKTMQHFASQYDKNVRPHAKTHKCSKLAALQLESGACGICVTKVSEALELAKNNICGILITSPIVTDYKLSQLQKVVDLAPDTMVVCDQLKNLEQLNALAQMTRSRNIDVIIDIDAGIGRTGTDFESAFDLASSAYNMPFITLKGIQCYAGHFQHITDKDERANASKALLQKAASIKHRLEKMLGISLIQTGSGTGTYEIDCQIDGVTEIQPGSYTVMDKEYLDIDYTSAHFLPAMTMLSTVISANHQEHVTVDAGLKALYKDPTKPKIISHNELYYDWDYFGDEHGKLTGTNLPQNGDVIEMIVPHCDPTINLFDHFYITENDIVVDIWLIDLRGKSQ